MSFEADHIIVPGSTGFVWNARVHVAPLLHVRVRDSLLEGRGPGHVSFLSAFTVAENAHGTSCGVRVWGGLRRWSPPGSDLFVALICRRPTP